MDSVLFINALQVNFNSMITMEHSGMVKMFKSLEDSGLKGFLEGSGSIYEEVVLEFFANAKILAGTIEIALEMRRQFSGSDEPFKAPNKKRDMPIEFRLLHDIVAKALCSKAGSFDQVTNKKLDLMVAITAGLKGFAIQVSAFLQYIVKDNLGESVKLHSRKVLTSKSVQTYIKQNSEIKPTGETSKNNEDTASNTEGGASQDFVKRRNQRKHTQMGWTAANISSQPDPNPVSPTAQEKTMDDQIVHGDGGDCFEKGLGVDTREEHEERNDQEITRISSQFDSIPTVPVEGEGNLDDEHLNPSSNEPEKTYREHNVHIGNNDHMENPGCETQLDSVHPTTKDTGAIQNEQVPVEEYCQLLFTSAWNNVSAQITMFEEWLHFRREVRLRDISSAESLVKIEEQLLEWGEKEGISDLFERHSLVMYKIFELELEKLYHEHLANFKLDVAAQTASLQLNQPRHETPAMTSHEHQAQENDPSIQTDEHRPEGNEHRALDELLIASASADTSTLQLLDTATQSLTALSTRVSSLDQAYACIRNDTNVTRHHTILMRDQLKNAVDGLDIKIYVLECTLTQRIVDELAVVKSQLAALIEGMQGFGADKKGE
ncbi:hypothetical protein F511_38267 [Dorcoceras hygrometricum]|uniref:Uncharacterized protein n=1 Tax=Dorcoceras hygrometricum TaxID=472368 RepID=A0A2Z7D9D3_9LAMI|nr:hypothetical protein F511_38267 [Dorcoceras hygrometricum]